MKRALLCMSLMCLAGYADEWSGRLVDAACTHRNGGPEACDPGVDTTAFGMVVAGKAYLFDKSGSQKARVALKDRAAMLAVDPNYPHASPVNASVTGRRAGNTILVKRIVLQ